MALSWPLVGRQEELSRIAAAMGHVGTSGLVVTGTAGVGKTRLVSEALARAPAAKFSVHRATATHAAATMPLAALSHLLPDSDDQLTRHSNLLRSTARNLTARGRQRRVVVAVDDAHLLDEASAALLHHFATASPVFVLATVRDAEPAPDAVRRLCKDHVTARLNLAPLSADEVGDATRMALDGPVAWSVVHRVTSLSEGIPLLVTELVDGALAEGRLERAEGLWRFAGPWVSGRTLPELVRERLARVDPAVYAAVELVALGEPLGAAELETMLTPQVIAAAEREGLFAGTASQRRQQVRLVHPLYGEALRAAITPLRARAAYRQLAGALAATGTRRRGDVLRLAVWRLESGQAADPELMLRAVREEGALFDRSMAERLARAAEEAGGGLPARLVRVDALRWLGRAEEAEEVLTGADGTNRSDEQRGRVATVRASNLYFGLNRPADAERVIAETREGICRTGNRGHDRSPPAVCDEMDALRADFRFNAGHVGDAVDLAAAVLARPGGNARVQIGIAPIAAISWTFHGQPDRAAAVAERALDRYRRTDEQVDFGVGDRVKLGLCFAHAFAGRLGYAQQLGISGYHGALDHHADALQGEWALGLGYVALASGKVATAQRWLREAVAQMERHAPTLGRYGAAYALTFLAEAAALSGDISEVEAALARADDLVPAEVILHHRERGRCWAAAARGEVSTARSIAMESAATLAATRAHLLEAMALHDVARLGAPEQVTGRLGLLAPQIEGHFGAAYAQHAATLVARDATALEEVATGFSAAGASLLAAEAAAEASAAYRRAGRKGSALAAAERSRELVRQCEGARTPALALAGEPLPLTPREREIATLAAHGLADREIAAQLVISERTVHNHLHHTYMKLGVNTRRHLRSILG